MLKQTEKISPSSILLFWLKKNFHHNQFNEVIKHQNFNIIRNQFHLLINFFWFTFNDNFFLDFEWIN